uniref:Peptidase S8/S53 domain-containing protein n=1 Tax=Aegilops tauschii subsp. strangulata TaxID=200361 RepID=A0A453L2U0_AEGTS
SVFPNRGHKLHTTRSWEFLGMEKDGRVRPNSIWAKARYGEGVIIGNLDTGGCGRRPAASATTAWARCRR